MASALHLVPRSTKPTRPASSQRPSTFQSQSKAPRAASGAPPTFSQGFCSYISHWLSSGWRSGGCDGEAPVQRRLQVTSESLADRPDPTDASGCKACREWHVACDHAKPQCAHCYQQQILCFYVDPHRPGRNARKAETVPRLVEPTPDSLVRSQPHAAR